MAGKPSAAGRDHSRRSSVASDSLLGRDVFDADGRHIGELYDIVLDIATGRITHVFVALNQGKYADQRVMAPWDALIVDLENQCVRFKAAVSDRPLVRRPTTTERFAND